MTFDRFYNLHNTFTLNLQGHSNDVVWWFPAPATYYVIYIILLLLIVSLLISVKWNEMLLVKITNITVFKFEENIK